MSYLTLESNTISDNQAGADDSGAGGGICLDSTTGTLTRNTITGNVAGAGGGLFAMSVDEMAEPDPTLVGNFIDGNIATQDGGGLYPDNVYGVTITWSTAYPSGIPCDPVMRPFNYAKMPGFLEYSADGDWTNDDLHLSLTSALTDRGTWPGVDPDGTPTDIGLYGGDGADGWDRDGDSYPDWFWPGTIADAPSGYDALNYDADDFDETLY